MKHKKQMTVHWKQGYDESGPTVEYTLFCCDMSAYGHVVVSKQEIEFEVPDNWNPVPAQIEMLNKEMEKVQEEFSKRVKAIKDQIANLTCLEFSQ